MLTGHGDDAYVYGKAVVANFSSNVYYGGFPDGIRDQLIASIDQIAGYPDANAESLERCLAQWHGLSNDRLIVTNGATEAFYLIAHAFRQKSATIVVPSFAEYEDACRAHDLDLQFLNWDELAPDTRFTTGLVFLGNPNNPTGAVLKKEQLQRIVENNAQSLFVIDEAYVDFTQEDVSLVAALAELNNLVIVKSLTKTYAIPGLRLGYLLSNPEIIRQLLRVKMPWSVNALAIEAGKYLVQHHTEYALPLDALLHDTQELIGRLNGIEHLQALPTQTNFFLCRLRKGTAAELKAFLLQEYGVLIRDASNFRGLTEAHVRIATQTQEKNKLLINGICRWTAGF